MNATRWLLGPLSVVYGGAIWGRNLYYDRSRSASRRAAVPVVSIGNLTVGGTGKTPFAIEVVRRLAALGRRPANVKNADSTCFRRRGQLIIVA